MLESAVEQKSLSTYVQSLTYRSVNADIVQITVIILTVYDFESDHFESAYTQLITWTFRFLKTFVEMLHVMCQVQFRVLYVSYHCSFDVLRTFPLREVDYTVVAIS